MKFYRVNYQVQGQTLRVLDEDNKQIGVLSKADALKKAQELGLDLVEIAPTANPPVCKIIDFKKFRYTEEKRARESRKKAKASDTKELHLGPFMSDNDLQVRLARAKEFLKEGHKVKVVLKFAGRQITHPEFGWQIMNKMISGVSEFGKTERPPKLEGKLLVATLTSGKTGEKALVTKENYGKTENEKGSSKTI